MLALARGRAWRRTTASALPPVPGRNVGRAFTPAAWGVQHRKVSGPMESSSRRQAWRLAAASALPPVPGRHVGRAFTPAAKALRHRGGSGTMESSSRRQAWRLAAASASPPVPGRNVGRAFTPAAKALRYRKVSGTMQASSPTKHGARPCQALQDISAARRQCTPPSAPSGASTSPYRGGFANGFPPKGSPARGCGVERRLRRIQRDGAGAAVAERKCASAHAARCGHRKPVMSASAD